MVQRKKIEGMESDIVRSLDGTMRHTTDTNLKV